jgi:hypothetical protein
MDHSPILTSPSMAWEDKKIDEIAEYLKTRRLDALAAFMIEAHWPLQGIASAMLTAAHPFTSVLFGQEKAGMVLSLFAERSNMERLVRALELRPNGTS